MNETIYTVPECPVSFALLSDLHGELCFRVIDSLRKHRPQRIFISGDIIYRAVPEYGLIVRDQENVLPLLRKCAAIAPTYLSLGNHDMLFCREDLKLISQTGVRLLDDEFLRTGELVIGGLTSGYVLAYRKFRLETAGNKVLYPKYGTVKKIRSTIAKVTADPQENIPNTSWLPEFAAAPGYHILLSHHPEYFRMIPGNVELILSGHAHGGQWNYYSFHDRRWRGVLAPGQGLFPKYTSGIYDGRMIVSRGLANTTRIPRINNPEEIVYVRGENVK